MKCLTSYLTQRKIISTNATKSPREGYVMPQTLYTVHPVRTAQVLNWIPNEGAYRFNLKGRMPLLQKLCFFILKHLRCDDMGEQVTTKFFQFDSEDIVSIVIQNDHAMYELINKRAKYVIMGHDYYERLTRDTDYMTHWMFEFPHQYMTSQYKPNGAFAGIKVVFIPWMSGMVVLPELP